MNRFQRKLNKRVKKTILSTHNFSNDWTYKKFRSIIKFANNHKEKAQKDFEEEVEKLGGHDGKYNVR